ncbi:unnamed protein product [Lampetra fluviatilis]
MNAPNLVSQPRICGLLPFPPVPLDDAHSRSYGIGSSPAEAPSSAGVQLEPCETFRCCSCYDNWPPESPHQTQPPVSPPQPPLPPPPLAAVDSQDQHFKSMSAMDAHDVQQRQYQDQQQHQQWQHRQYQRQYRDQQKRRQVKPEQLLSLLERVCTIHKPRTKRRSRPPGQTGTTNASHEWSYRETPDWRAAPVPAAARRLPDLLSQTTATTATTAAMTPGSRPPLAATETTTATVDRKQTSVGRYMAAMNLGGGRRYDDDDHDEDEDRDAAREGPATDANGGPSSFWRRAIGRCVCPRGEEEEEQEGAALPKAVDIRFTECGEMFVDLRVPDQTLAGALSRSPPLRTDSPAAVPDTLSLHH